MLDVNQEWYSYVDEEALELVRKIIAIQEPGTDVLISFHYGTQYEDNEGNIDDDGWEISTSGGYDNADYYGFGSVLKEACKNYLEKAC
jgi:hypothetical protein